jgi:hypothetical protein
MDAQTLADCGGAALGPDASRSTTDGRDRAATGEADGIMSCQGTIAQGSPYTIFRRAKERRSLTGVRARRRQPARPAAAR